MTRLPKSPGVQLWRGRLSLSGEVRIGDLLTAATILISLTSVLVSWSVDRRIRLTKEANDIRAAAAETLGDLERWNSLSLSLYGEVQAALVEASESATEPGGLRRGRVERARDILWKRINEEYAAIVRRKTEEKIDNGYTKLFGYFPVIRMTYKASLTQLRKVDSENLLVLLSRLETVIMRFANADRELHSAEIGNALRAVANEVRENHQAKLRSAMKDAEVFLIDKIEASDERLLRK